MANAVNKIVPMPSFTDPNLPEAAGGSVNFGVAGNFPDFEDHPVKHSDDYGAAYLRGPSGNDVDDTASVREGGDDEEDRDSWGKESWVELAKAYDLPHSGTKDELRERVEAHEADLESGEED